MCATLWPNPALQGTEVRYKLKGEFRGQDTVLLPHSRIGFGISCALNSITTLWISKFLLGHLK